jgi:hypothetical protein
MTTMSHGEQSGPRDRVVFALILIIVGIGGLATQLLETRLDVGGWVVLLIGLTFLGAFFTTHRYGFLVPGGILSGLGVGIVLQQSLALSGEQSGGIVVLGLGLGFASIWAIGALTRAVGQHAWPLIPGVILGTVGTALMIGGQAIQLLDYWGIGVIALGVLLLWRGWTDSGHPVR